MLNKHPGAQLLKAAGEPPVDIRFGEDQYIQCTAVTPEPDRDQLVFNNPDVPLAVRTYYEHRSAFIELLSRLVFIDLIIFSSNSGINLFSSSRQVRKTTRDGTEEVWVEKTYYTTEQAFPTVLRRSEVINMELIEISPLEIALQEVEDKTKELAGLYLKYQGLAKTVQNFTTNALAMALNGAVDAPLNTGVAAYRQIFFGPDYVARNPERAELVEKLRTAIDEQVRMIDSCLKLHGLLCPPEFIPFHETLDKFFKKNFRDEIRRLAVDSDAISVSTTRSQQYSYEQTSTYGDSVKRSMSSSSTARYNMPPLNVGRSVLTPAYDSPISPGAESNGSPHSKQTPLQRQIAHLTRHGINGVSSAPGDLAGTDSLSAESPHNSFVNVGNGIHSTPAAQTSSASVAGSYMGSMGSLGSLRGRFSRFGSLRFGRSAGSSS